MTETQTLTLTTFLLARFAEDEAVARDAIDPDGWVSSSDGRWLFEEVPYEGEWPRNPDRVRLLLEADSPWTVHCSRHDPARVLAEVEAKRRIVALHEGEHHCTTYSAPEDNDPCVTLRLLAAPYSDHPEFRAAWRA